MIRQCLHYNYSSSYARPSLCLSPARALGRQRTGVTPLSCLCWLPHRGCRFRSSTHATVDNAAIPSMAVHAYAGPVGTELSTRAIELSFSVSVRRFTAVRPDMLLWLYRLHCTGIDPTRLCLCTSPGCHNELNARELFDPRRLDSTRLDSTRDDHPLQAPQNQLLNAVQRGRASLPSYQDSLPTVVPEGQRLLAGVADAATPSSDGTVEFDSAML